MNTTSDNTTSNSFTSTFSSFTYPRSLTNKHNLAAMETLSPRSLLSGAIFGATLTAAGVYSPTVIIKQMHFHDFHMMKAFLSASASSAFVPSPLPNQQN